LSYGSSPTAFSLMMDRLVFKGLVEKEYINGRSMGYKVQFVQYKITDKGVDYLIGFKDYA
jgi:hypothetical protein